MRWSASPTQWFQPLDHLGLSHPTIPEWSGQPTNYRGTSHGFGQALSWRFVFSAKHSAVGRLFGSVVRKWGRPPCPTMLGRILLVVSLARPEAVKVMMIHNAAEGALGWREGGSWDHEDASSASFPRLRVGVSKPNQFWWLLRRTPSS